MSQYKYVKYFVLIVFLFLLLNCATAPVHEIEQVNLDENYFFTNLKIIDSRPEIEKSLNKIDKGLSSKKPIFLSGSLCPNKTDILDLGEKMNRIVDSLNPSEFVEVHLLNYYVKARPKEEGSDDIEHAAIALGVTGLVLEGWNVYRVIQSIGSLEEEDPLMGLVAPYIFLAAPVLVFIPHDWVSTLGLLFTSTSVLLFGASSPKGETETVIAVKINRDEDILVSKHYEELNFGGKIKAYKTGSDGEVFSAVDLEVIRKMIERIENNFLNEFRKRVEKIKN